MSVSSGLDSLEPLIEILQNQIDLINSSLTDSGSGLDVAWLLVAGTLVFFMQAGFALLEAGTVRTKNTVNILFKNLIDGGISAICFWLFGYAFAYGNTADGFIGQTKFGLASDEFDLGDGSSQLDYQSFFFQWAFAATAATIVSGSVAERCKLEAYFAYSAVITAFIYPVIVHWGWGPGWLSPFGPDPQGYLFYGRKSNNFIDFAGSGIVHTVGGLSGLVGAMFLGPREGRFYIDKAGVSRIKDMPGHSIPLVVLGTIILWVGWYGFNAGSTLCIVGDCGRLAAKVAVVTTISAASATITMIGLQTFVLGTYDVSMVCNALLAGLVSVTAPCAVIDLWAAMIIGIAGTLVYLAASKLLLLMRIDDPLDASPIHGACGIWGVIAVGIFGNDDNAAFAGYPGSAANFHPFRSGEQFAVQIVGILCIMAWTLCAATVLFLLIDLTLGLRVEQEVEKSGLDSSEHGTVSYIISSGSKQLKSAPAAKTSIPAAALPPIVLDAAEQSERMSAQGMINLDDDDDNNDGAEFDQIITDGGTLSRKSSGLNYSNYPEFSSIDSGDIRGIPLSPLTETRKNVVPVTASVKVSATPEKAVEATPKVIDSDDDENDDTNLTPGTDGTSKRRKSVEESFFSPLEDGSDERLPSVARVEIHCGWYVDHSTFVRRDGSQQSGGQYGGTLQEAFELEEDEYITKLEYYQVMDQLRSLQIFTSKGRKSPVYGGHNCEGGLMKKSVAEAGFEIVGLQRAAAYCGVIEEVIFKEM